MSRKNKHRVESTKLDVFRKMPNVTVSDEVRDYKMSEVFIDFARPYLSENPTRHDLETAYGLAMIAWNLALQPPHERIRLLMQTLQQIPEDGRLPFKNALAEMIRRKEQYFADYRRPILEYEIVDQGERYHLTVLSDATAEEEGKGTPAGKE